MFKSKAYITLTVLLVLAVVKVNAYALVNTLNIKISSASASFKTNEAETALYVNINTATKSRPHSQSAPAYFKTIDRIVAAGFKEQDSGVSSKPVITVDGITLLVKIPSSAGTFKLSEWSLNSGSQPLLCQLVRQSLDAYSKQNNDLFLTNRTYDY